METITPVIDKDKERRPAFITGRAYDALPTLCKIYEDELGVSVSYIDAISKAVLEAIEKRTAQKEAK